MFILVISIVSSRFQTLPQVIEVELEKPSTQCSVIYVVDHGKHSGIVFPAFILHHFVPALQKRFGSPRYYEVGWGDSAFYKASGASIRLALRALLIPTESIMHVVAFNHNPRHYFRKSDIISLEIDEKALNTMAQFVSRSFLRDVNGTIISERKGLYGDSQFFTGTGEYHLFNTCNKWTAKALRSGGVDVITPHVIMSWQVMWMLR